MKALKIPILLLLLLVDLLEVSLEGLFQPDQLPTAHACGNFSLPAFSCFIEFTMNT